MTEGGATAPYTRLALNIIRIFLGVVFLAYGLVKLFGGQFHYGDWTIEKSTVDGPFLVWAFYGYSPVYARFIGMAEAVPALLLLFPRTATIGAAALFAVALNVTIMDFAFGFPSVKYASLLYTVLLGVLLWADRKRLLALVAGPHDPPYGRPAHHDTTTLPRAAKLALAGLATSFLLFTANLLATSLDKGPEEGARRIVESAVADDADVRLVRSRYQGLFGIGRTATVDFVVAGAAGQDTVRVHARKALGFTPWRFD